MAPRVRKKKKGQTREDAARDRMKDYGFTKRIIDEGIKQLLEVYCADPWFLIESESYYPLLDICLHLTEQLAEEEQANQLAEKQTEIALKEEQHEYQLHQEQDQHVENVEEERDQATNDPSPAAFHVGEALSGFATHSVAVEGMHCGWLSSEEEDSDGDDEEIIPRTPEPLCEELGELVEEVRGLKRRKKETSWDK